MQKLNREKREEKLKEMENKSSRYRTCNISFRKKYKIMKKRNWKLKFIPFSILGE